MTTQIWPHPRLTSSSKPLCFPSQCLSTPQSSHMRHGNRGNIVPWRPTGAFPSWASFLWSNDLPRWGLVNFETPLDNTDGWKPNKEKGGKTKSKYELVFYVNNHFRSSAFKQEPLCINFPHSPPITTPQQPCKPAVIVCVPGNVVVLEAYQRANTILLQYYVQCTDVRTSISKWE